MSSFKEFLEKSQFKEHELPIASPVISIRALGEWALSTYNTLEVEPKNYDSVAKALLMEIYLNCFEKTKDAKK